jgi:hypothetical protein
MAVRRATYYGVGGQNSLPALEVPSQCQLALPVETRLKEVDSSGSERDIG